MTVPFNPAAQQDAGWRQLGGGYEDAIAQHQAGRQQQQVPQQMQQQVPLAQQMNQMQQQLQQQVPQNFQNAPQQPLAQHGQRFGDPRFAGAPGPQQLQQFGGMDQFRAAQYAQQLVQQGVPQQQVQAPQGIDLNQRVQGPGIPADLQGRTVGEIIQIHNGMRQVHTQLMSMQQQPQQGAPAQPQPQTQAQVQPGSQVQNQGDWDWRNPKASVTAAVREVLGTELQSLRNELAPVTQAGGLNLIERAIDTARAAVGPTFTQFEPLIRQQLQGANPRDLMNPQVWQVAAERAIGMTALQQQRMMAAQPQVQQTQQQQPQPPGLYAGQVVLPGQQPLPNLSTFFSEQPNQGGPGAQGFQLSPLQVYAASQMGIPLDQYAAFYAPIAANNRQGGFGR